MLTGKAHSSVDSDAAVGSYPRPSRCTFARRRIPRIRETPTRVAPRLTELDPLAAAGAMVFDCRPQVLPGAMDVSDIELSEIRSKMRASAATSSPPEREQSFGGGGGGGDLLESICPGLGVAPWLAQEQTAKMNCWPRLMCRRLATRRWIVSYRVCSSTLCRSRQ